MQLAQVGIQIASVCLFCSRGGGGGECNPTLMLDSGFTAFKQIEPKWYRVSMPRLLEDNVDKVLEIQRIPNVFQSEIVAQTFETI